MFTHSALAADIIQLSMPYNGTNKTITVTTNETTCDGLYWDGVPSKDGWMSGGHWEITAQLMDESVVVKELTQTAHEGISSETTKKTFIPKRKLPWTGAISQTTVTVFRLEQNLDETKESQQGGPGYPPQGVGSPDP